MPGTSIFVIPMAVAVYYAVVWAVRGRDLKPGVAVTRYEPPKNVTPAAARFARVGYSDGKTLAAALVSMAVKRAITISPENDEWVVASAAPAAGAPEATDALRRTSSQYPQLAPEERRMFDLIFGWGDPVRFKGFEQQRASVLVNDIESSMRDQYEKRFYVRNGKWIAGGIFASFAALMGASARMPGDGTTFMALWLFWFMLGLMMIAVLRLGQAFADIVRGRVSWKMAASTLVSTPLFFSIPLLVAWKVAQQSSRELVLALLLSVALHALSLPLLKRRSRECRQLLDELDGYRHFLASVDAAQLQQFNVPGRPAELMNEPLAYAIALDIDERWGERFAGAFAAATVAVG
jgi:hypothetical protein